MNRFLSRIKETRRKRNLIVVRLRDGLEGLAKAFQSGGVVQQSQIDELRAIETYLELQHRQALLGLAPWIGAFVVCFATIILIMCTVRQRISEFEARIETPLVHFQAKGSIDLTRISGTNAKVGGLLLSSPPGSIGEVIPQREVEGATNSKLNGLITIQSVYFPDEGAIGFLYGPGYGHLQIHTECLGSQCRQGGYTAIATSERPLTSRDGSGHARIAGQVSGNPIGLRFLEPSSDISIELGTLRESLMTNVEVIGVSFVDAQDDPTRHRGQSVSWSGVFRGRIRLPATGREVVLQNGAWVTINGPRLRVIQVVPSDSSLIVLMRGNANDLRVGAGGTDHNLRPTWMDLVLARQGSMIAIGWGLVTAALALVGRFLATLYGKS